jgi:hypothetical protein
MSVREYTIVLTFTTIPGMLAHMEMMDEFQHWKETKSVKKENDKRGQHIKEFHVKARKLHEEKPELTYRECLKNVSKKVEEVV